MALARKWGAQDGAGPGMGGNGQDPAPTRSASAGPGCPLAAARCPAAAEGGDQAPAPPPRCLATASLSRAARTRASPARLPRREETVQRVWRLFLGKVSASLLRGKGPRGASGRGNQLKFIWTCGHPGEILPSSFPESRLRHRGEHPGKLLGKLSAAARRPPRTWGRAHGKRLAEGGPRDRSGAEWRGLGPGPWRGCGWC